MLSFFLNRIHGIEDEYSEDNDSYLGDDDYFITDNTESDSFIYRLSADGSVKAIMRTSECVRNSEVWQVSYVGGSIWALLEDTTLREGENTSVYMLLGLDRELKPQMHSNWFSLYEKGEISDLTYSEDMFCLTQISLDKNQVYIYPLANLQMIPFEKNYDDEIRFVETIKYADFAKAGRDETVYFASYSAGKLSMITDEEAYASDALKSDGSVEAYNKKKFTLSQLIYLNNDLAWYTLAAYIIGLALLASIFVLIYRRNRVAYMILLWEMMCAIATASGMVASGRRQISMAMGAIGFLVISALGIVVLVISANELREFRLAMEKLSRGRHDYRKPKITGEDMNDLWNAFFDLERAIYSTHHERFKVLEKYYAYTPKGIERLHGKESILDVKSGDVAGNTGILVRVNTDFTNSSQKIFSLISEYEDNGIGVLAKIDVAKGYFEMILFEGRESLTRIGTDIKNLNLSSNTRMLVHYGEFLCRIHGVKNSMHAQIIAGVWDEMTENDEFFKSMQVPMIVTQEVLDVSKEKLHVRYIGKIFAASVGRDIVFYEILDVESDRERKLKIDMNDTFQKGIELYTNKDYYMSRGCFAEVLRHNPQDSIARNYLFVCEEELSSISDY